MSELSSTDRERLKEILPHSPLFDSTGLPLPEVNATVEEHCRAIARSSSQILAVRPHPRPTPDAAEANPSPGERVRWGLAGLILGIFLGALGTLAIVALRPPHSPNERLGSGKSADPTPGQPTLEGESPSPSLPSIEWLASPQQAEEAAERLVKFEKVEGFTPTDILKELAKEETLKRKIQELRRKHQNVPYRELEQLVKQRGIALRDREGKPRRLEAHVDPADLDRIRDKMVLEELRVFLRLSTSPSPGRRDGNWSEASGEP